MPRVDGWDLSCTTSLFESDPLARAKDEKAIARPLEEDLEEDGSAMGYFPFPNTGPHWDV